MHRIQGLDLTNERTRQSAHRPHLGRLYPGDAQRRRALAQHRVQPVAAERSTIWIRTVRTGRHLRPQARGTMTPAYLPQFGPGMLADQCTHAELIQHRKTAGRQTLAAHLLSGVDTLFDQHHMPARLREEYRGSRTRGTRANDEDVGIRGHGAGSSRALWRMARNTCENGHA